MPARSLRTTFGVATVALTGIALLVVSAVVLTTRHLRATNRELGAAVESVQLSHQATIDLLLLARTGDPVVRQGLEQALLARLAALEALVTSPREAELLGETRRDLEGYFAAPTDLQRFVETYASISTLVELNVAQARASNADAALWDRRGTSLGIGAGAVILAITGAMVWWLRARTFRPMSRLADTMARYGRGDPTARARDEGPAEIRAMATQFNDMAADLAARQRAQTAFLGGVAHDLRNPIGAIRLTVEQLGLLVENGTLPGDRVQPALLRLQRSLSRVDRMIDDFLDVSRIEAGQLGLERQRCDVRDIVADTVANLDAPPSHPVNVSLPEQPIVTTGDPMRLEQALGNLIGNAVKYSPEGGAIDVRAAADDSAVVIEVVDRGIGMSDDDLRRLFEPFGRVGSARGIPGIGLGLFVTRRIVEAHGGAIEVESSPGKGSLFRVRLPASPT